VPFIVDVDDSYGTQARPLRAELKPSDLDFYRVQEADALETLRLLNGSVTVGYSHRGEGRQPIPIVMARDQADRVMDARRSRPPSPRTPSRVGAAWSNWAMWWRSREERASFPVFRHNGHDVIMVTGELAGDFEAPLYGMLAVAERLDAMDWPEGLKPEIRLNGQPERPSRPSFSGTANGR
jgi:hypothetical protein